MAHIRHSPQGRAKQRPATCCDVGYGIRFTRDHVQNGLVKERDKSLVLFVTCILTQAVNKTIQAVRTGFEDCLLLCRSYEYIVKGGEDVRIDQRIQQLFSIMNGHLQAHAGASSHRLQVRRSQA